MIFVAGATGLLGREVCHRLVERGATVQALVRPTADPAKVAGLVALGVEIAAGDLRDPASLATACRRTSAVITTVSAMPFSYEAGVNDLATTDRAGTTALIEAASRAGVEHFIYTSFSGGIDVEFPLGDAKRDVEHALIESGLAYTILRPSYFMEVWLSPATGFDALNAKAAIYGSGENPISWISIGDVAEFAARSVGLPAALDRTLELGGPEPLSPLQVVAIFERVGGRAFELQFVPEEVLVAQQQAAGDPFLASFAALQRAYARGDAVETGRILDVFPIRLTPVEEYAARVVGAAAVPAG